MKPKHLFQLILALAGGVGALARADSMDDMPAPPVEPESLRPLIYAKAIARPHEDRVLVQVLIVNESKEALRFETGSHGATPQGGTPVGGTIKGPDEEEPPFSSRRVPGSARDVLPTFRFSTDGETREWTAVSFGGATFQNGRPSVFTVNPSQSIVYCSFLVNPDRVSGEFIGGEINTVPRWGRKARPFQKIPITQFAFEY